ncbi:MAG: nucleotidyltransferase domain-containing protein [Fervidicoccaceae archaeon]
MVEDAKRKIEVFENLEHYLKMAYRIVKELDEGAEIYVFGSLVEGKSLVSSDIDLLIVTSLPPEVVISKLWERGIKEPFEIHVVDREMFKYYLRKAKNLKMLEFPRESSSS